MVTLHDIRFPFRYPVYAIDIIHFTTSHALTYFAYLTFLLCTTYKQCSSDPYVISG